MFKSAYPITINWFKAVLIWENGLAKNVFQVSCSVLF